jgi:hypothetical protein
MMDRFNPFPILLLPKSGKERFSISINGISPCSTSANQHIFKSTHYQINTSSNQHIIKSTHQHINKSPYYHINFNPFPILLFAEMAKVKPPFP